MSNIFKVEWTITPTTAPQPWIACSTCRGPKPFKCSDKLRLNANGRRLDAWLIYRCTDCDKTWNRTLFERKNVRDIDPATLEALQSNDPDWIRGHAFDLGMLGRFTKRIDTFAECHVQKAVISDVREWSILEIAFSAPRAVSLRLDRLLSTELGMSRSRLQALYDAEALRITPDRKHAWKRPPTDRSHIALDLLDAIDRQTIGALATGSAPQ